MPTSEQGARAYQQVVRYLAQTPWAILPSTLALMREVISLRLEGHPLSDDEVAARIQAGPGRGGPARHGAVAVLPLYGLIVPKASLMTELSGGTSLASFGAALDQVAADPAVSAILIDIDSPGGSVELVPETAARIRAARARKPVVAVANTTAASAAYWLASQADEVVVSPSGMVGSVGVLSAHDDISAMQEQLGVSTTLISAGRYKAEGNPYEPLSDEARAAIQAVVDDFYGMFVADVATGRGVKAADVRGGFGEGRMLTAAAAVAEGMADRVETLEATIARLAGRPARRDGSSASSVLVEGIHLTLPPPAALAQTPAPEPDPQTTDDDHDSETLAEIRDRLVETNLSLKEA